MHKREQRAEQRRIEAEKSKKRIMRNWIIAAVALLLAILCYMMNEPISNFLQPSAESTSDSAQTQ
ncbi:MAG: hypothetical protein FWG44_08210 [Oscillospiraceae bacterium]|nr:hypothetical protein [Oscillospiraceae bacterium]